MNPAHPPLPASPQTAVLVFLVTMIVGMVIGGAALKLATKWVAGFAPSLGRACWAMVCAYIVAILADACLLKITGVTAFDPRIFLLFIPVGFLMQIVSYQAVLRGEESEEISLPQAALIVILQQVIIFVPLVAIVAGLIFMVGAAQFQQIAAKHGGVGGVPFPTGWTAPSTPTFATVADAQKEAVRRYPELAVSGSRMNKAYVDRYHFYQKTNPGYFADNSWPVRLADELANGPAAR